MYNLNCMQFELFTIGMALPSWHEFLLVISVHVCGFSILHLQYPWKRKACTSYCINVCTYVITNIYPLCPPFLKPFREILCSQHYLWRSEKAATFVMWSSALKSHLTVFHSSIIYQLVHYCFTGNKISYVKNCKNACYYTLCITIQIVLDLLWQLSPEFWPLRLLNWSPCGMIWFYNHFYMVVNQATAVIKQIQHIQWAFSAIFYRKTPKTSQIMITWP